MLLVRPGRDDFREKPHPARIRRLSAGKGDGWSGAGPVAISITPDGKTAYVVSRAVPGSSACGSGCSVTPIRTATNTALKAIQAGIYPAAISITPDGKTAYVATLIVRPREHYGVIAIDTATNTARNGIRTGTAPDDIAITPNGATAYVANSDNLYVTPFSTASGTAAKNITIGTYAGHIAITPDGETAYVTAAASRLYRMNLVTVIRTATNAAVKAIKVGRGPGTAIAITPDGTIAYVANYGAGTVTPIRTATDTALNVIMVGAQPVAIAITP